MNRPSWSDCASTTPDCQGQYGIYPIYRQAIEAFQGDAVRDLLLTYIGNPDFEVEAAFALRQYGTSDRISSPVEGFGRPKYEEVLPARERRSRERRPFNSVAAVLLDRIDALLQTGSADDFARAIGLATAIAQMDYGDRAATINAVLSAPGPMSPRYGLLLVQPFAGEIIPAAYVRQGYDKAVVSFLAQKWHSQNEWWAIDCWIELTAFTDAPESIIECVGELLDQFKHVHYFDRILYALGYIDPAQSLKVLTALAALVPDVVAHNYINACAQIGSAEAARHLVMVVCSPPAGRSHHHNLLELPNVLSVLLAKHAGVRQELLARAAADRGLAASPVFGRLLPSITGPHDILTLLRTWDARGDDHGSQILEHAVHNLSKEKFEVVFPSSSILGEPPVAVVDELVDKKGTRDLAEAYVKFLYTSEAQETMAQLHYRPRDIEALEKYRTELPPIPFFTIDETFGGWVNAHKAFFADGALFDQIYRPGK